MELHELYIIIVQEYLSKSNISKSHKHNIRFFFRFNLFLIYFCKMMQRQKAKSAHISSFCLLTPKTKSVCNQIVTALIASHLSQHTIILKTTNKNPRICVQAWLRESSPHFNFQQFRLLQGAIVRTPPKISRQRKLNTSNQFSGLCIVCQCEIEYSANYCCLSINLSAAWDQNTSLSVTIYPSWPSRSPSSHLPTAPQTMERQNSATLHHSAWTNFQNIGLNLSFKSFKSRLQLVRIYILHCLWLNNKHSPLSIIITWQLFYGFSFIILTGTSIVPLDELRWDRKSQYTHLLKFHYTTAAHIKL